MGIKVRVMKRYRYKTIFIDRYVETTKEERDLEKKGKKDTIWNPAPVTYRKSHPDRVKLFAGEYEPPQGWRIVSHQFEVDGISLLLEQEIVESPYR